MADETPPQAPQPLQAPMFYASTVAIESAGNDFTVTFSRGRPVIGLLNGQNVSLAEAQAIVSLSPQTAKDLWLVLGGVIKNWERDFGTVNSPFSKQQSNQPKARKGK